MSYFELPSTMTTAITTMTENSSGPSQSDPFRLQQRNESLPTHLLSSEWLKVPYPAAQRQQRLTGEKEYSQMARLPGERSPFPDVEAPFLQLP